MPVAKFHLSETLISKESARQILQQASAIYAEVLDSPIERTRVFISSYNPDYVAVGGEVCSDSEAVMAFFEFIVLEGRPLAQRTAIGEQFTQLLCNILNIDRSLVRGYCSLVRPEDWYIAGNPASAIRKAEVDARKQEQANG